MNTGESGTPDRDTPTTSSPLPRGADELSGISELFGLNRGDAADATRTSADTVNRWVSATEGTIYGSNDPSGRLVHGRYRLIAELGSGGMGVTYRAWDTQAGIPVVVKMPKREVRHDREVMARFAREIAAMQAVPHESIVPITDSGDDAGCPFVVMRFLPGGSLADYRRRDDTGKPLKNPPGMLIYWLPGVAAALDRIHARRLLHRDVKPGNIFLDGFLKPYLGDFGIAKVVDDSGGLEKEQTLTATRISVGTPEYMAPELFRPKSQPDGRVDQYALAVTVYEMLSGEKPFTGSAAHIIVEHSSLPVPPLEKKCPGLRPSVYAAVHKALAKKPEERFATCEEFAAAVLAEIDPLEPEVDTVRLLCPSCRNILKLPQKSAGKKGRCPRCQSVMDVADDIGSLWLESEERGEGIVVPAKLAEQTAETKSTTFRKQTFESIQELLADTAKQAGQTDQTRPTPPIKKAFERWFDKASAIAGLFAGLFAGLVLGIVLGLVGGHQPAYVAGWGDAWKRREWEMRSALDESRRSVDAANGTVRELQKQLAAETNNPVNLDLVGHTSFTDAQLQALAAVDERLILNSLTRLSDTQAEALSKHRSALGLVGLTTLTDAQAGALAKHQGGWLVLSGLTTLTDAQAEALAKHQGGWLVLNGLTTLTEAQAEALARHQGGLDLNGLTMLTDAQAEALAKHQGGLELNGLTMLTDAQAEAWAKHKGKLTLNGVTTLTARQAEALAKRRDGWLSLKGLTTLTAKAAATLRGHPNVGMPRNVGR